VADLVDDAAHARETCIGGVAFADTSDISAMPDALADAAFAAPTRELRRECASIDMPAPGSALSSKDMQALLQYPVQRRAPQRKIFATVNELS